LFSIRPSSNFHRLDQPPDLLHSPSSSSPGSSFSGLFIRVETGLIFMASAGNGRKASFPTSPESHRSSGYPNKGYFYFSTNSNRRVRRNSRTFSMFSDDQ
jgi:hypothetical protein